MKKMSKSDGSFVTISDLEKQGINPLSFRYFVLQSKYRQPVFFEIENIEASQTALNRLKNKIQDILKDEDTLDSESIKGIENNISDIIDNDLDTPKLIAYLWDLVKDENINKSIIEKFDSMLGLKLLENKKITVEITEEVSKLIEERNIARQNKDWNKSDELRDTIKKLGFDLLDKSNGDTEVSKID